MLGATVVLKYSNRFSARSAVAHATANPATSLADEAQHNMSTVAPTNAAGAAYAEHSNNWRKVKQMSLKMIATHHKHWPTRSEWNRPGEDLRVAQALHGGLQGALSGETGGSVLAADADLFRQAAPRLWHRSKVLPRLSGASPSPQEDGHEDDPNKRGVRQVQILLLPLARSALPVQERDRERRQNPAINPERVHRARQGAQGLDAPLVMSRCSACRWMSILSTSYA